MADYTASNTPRLKVLQTGPRGSHHNVFRFAPATSVVNMVSQSRAITLAALGLCLLGTTWESAELALEGSEVFLPVAWGAPQVNTIGPAAVAGDEYGRYVNFVGRSTGGSRAAFYFFNVVRDSGTANNRLTAAEAASVTDVLDAIASDAINLVGIDQNPVIMKSYANTGINDAVAKKSRSLA